MLESVLRQVRLFTQEMDRLANLENPINSNETFLELLLSKNIDCINKDIYLLLINMVRSCPYLANVKSDSLYIVFYPGRLRQVECMLGNDFFSPQIEIPTFDQFHEAYDWYRKNKASKNRFFTSVDDFVRERVVHSLEVIRSLKEVLYYEINPWEYVFLSSEGPDIRRDIFRIANHDLSQVRRKVKFLKETNAPLFMHEECKYDLERVRKILECLNNTNHN